jgi:hypothetical protein
VCVCVCGGGVLEQNHNNNANEKCIHIHAGHLNDIDYS